MSGSQLLLLGGVPAAATPVDPYFYSVTSLLHGDGTNGGQNNTFLDSSSNNFTITRNGNTTQGSFSPFSQTGWSNYFDGSSNLVTTASQVIPTGSFTIEAWAFVTSSSATQTILAQGTGVGDAGRTWIGIESSSGAKWAVQIGGTQAISSLTPVLNSWTHVAMTYNGSTITLYVNGISVASASVTQNASNTTLKVGANWGAYNLTGYVSNARVSNSVIYTSNFTPSTSPFSAAAGTVFLSCQSNRFVDTSSNAYAITTSGTPSVQPFSPFNPTTAYSTSSIGGSGYFDGSGDYLSIANNAAFNLGTNSFCIDGWFYPTTTNATQLVFNKWGTASDAQSMFQIGRISSTFYAQLRTTSGYVTLSTATWIPNAWNHFAVVRSGSTISAYLNGTRFGTDTSNPTLNSGTDTMTIGSKQAQDYFTGYISDCRIVNGSAIYDPTQTSITVPTAPTTAVTNTAFLSSNTNGAIFDNAADADYETVGNAQISTSVKKYGTGSLAFDGTGDYLVTNAPSTDLFAFGTGDFTIEFWLYLNSTSGTPMIYDGRPSLTNGAQPTIYMNGAVITYYTNAANRITGSSLSTSTWYHVALCRVASQTKMFVNGTQVGATYADTTAYTNTAGRPVYGVDGNSGNTNYLNGYVDDLRISKGVGRYAYNFTPPTAEFPNIGGTVTLTADPYYDYTTLLLPGNGTNGAQNNTFIDSSTNAFTITRNGNTTQGTFSPFSQTGWGNYCSGTTDSFSVASNATLSFGTGDFTIEFWIFRTGTNEDIVFEGRSTEPQIVPHVQINPSGYALFYVNGAARITGTTVLSQNTWYHVAVARSGTNTKLFVNGTQEGSTYSDSNNYTIASTVFIGRDYSGSANAYLQGYLSNLRAVKGTAVYTSNFTPPTSALTAISGTSLLMSQSNRFVDNSTNAFAITVYGSPSIQAFSPFNPTASWSAATYGGSGYFDGSGDYLQAGTNANLALGSGDFTIEGWHYCTGYNGGGSLYSTINTYPSSTGLLFYIDSIGRYTIDVNGTILQPAGTAVLNAWVHWAVVRNGSTLSIYINGTSIGSVSSSTNYTDQYAVIGRTGAGTNSNLFLGYLSNTRMVKGTAVYTANFTPPTAPLTAVTNTQLLCNFTNAGIYDATSKNNLETVGNAQISTTQSKFGGSSIYFDGSGDDLRVINAGITTAFGTGDFTVEFWVYANSWNTFNNLIDFRKVNDYFMIAYVSGALQYYNNGAYRINAGSLSTATWYHVAVCRYSSVTRMFVNGIQLGGDYADTSTYPLETVVTIGARNDDVGNPFNGYMQDVRITRGIGRYTRNFTPPTTAFLTL